MKTNKTKKAQHKQKTKKMSKTDQPKNRELTQVLVKGQQFMSLITKKTGN